MPLASTITYNSGRFKSCFLMIIIVDITCKYCECSVSWIIYKARCISTHKHFMNNLSFSQIPLLYKSKLMKQILDFWILYESTEGHSIQSSLLYAFSSVSLSTHSNEASMYTYEVQKSQMNYNKSTVSKKCPRKNVSIILFLLDVRFLDGIQ